MEDLLPRINGYQLLENWSTSGSCRWSYAEKDGRQWFIKQFMAPKYKRIEDGISPQKVEASRVRCEAFRERQMTLYNKIKDANTGNIIIVDSFFRYESMFYAVTERVDISSASISDISQMEHEQKMVLLKVLSHSVNCLHKNGVVHADLKPDNVLIKKTKAGYTLKLIDFDASFLESQPRRGEQICFDVSFVAPETIAAYNDEAISLTNKIDIFALALLFHLYYTGCMPEIPEGYANVCEAIRDGKTIIIDTGTPKWLQRLISTMLSCDPDDRPTSEQVFQALLKQEFPFSPVPEPGKVKKGFHLPPKLTTF